MKQSYAGRLDIVSGTQQGASAHLPLSSPVVLGASMTSDIVLRDASVSAQHLKLMLDGECINIESIDGTLLVDGAELPSGQSTEAYGTSLLQLGNVALMISTCDADQTYPKSTPILNNAPIKSRVGIVGVLMVFVLAMGGTLVWQSGSLERRVVETVSLEKWLIESSFNDLKILQTGNVATIGGFVNTHQEALRLDALLDTTGLQVNNEVLIGEALSEQVADVFRVNGIHAQVSVEPAGVVKVLTAVADAQHLTIVERSVLNDVPHVGQLIVSNTPPQSQANDPVADYVMDPGKRVAMVVSDELSYVVTEDQSRYFIGALLPSGHRIKSIQDGNVSLEKSGVMTVLEF